MEAALSVPRGVYRPYNIKYTVVVEEDFAVSPFSQRSEERQPITRRHTRVQVLYTRVCQIYTTLMPDFTHTSLHAVE